jgi:CBS domain containing-hemolysin-like protein
VNPRVSRVLYVAIVTFVMAIAVSFVSKILLGRVGLFLGLFVLFLIVAIGVVFDVIGTATTAAKERPLNAMASKKVYGAKQALRMTRSADRVASFCNDIIGDMTGTVSGAIGAAIALELVMRARGSPAGETAVSTVIVGFIAALTVGGKAWGKNAAISEPEQIILTVGKVMAWLEDSIGLVILPDRKAVNRKKGLCPAKKYTEGDSNSGKTS